MGVSSCVGTPHISVVNQSNVFQRKEFLEHFCPIFFVIQHPLFSSMNITQASSFPKITPIPLLKNWQVSDFEGLHSKE